VPADELVAEYAEAGLIPGLPGSPAWHETTVKAGA
jgi:hypothetical protein